MPLFLLIFYIFFFWFGSIGFDKLVSKQIFQYSDVFSVHISEQHHQTAGLMVFVFSLVLLVIYTYSIIQRRAVPKYSRSAVLSGLYSTTATRWPLLSILVITSSVLLITHWDMFLSETWVRHSGLHVMNRILLFGASIFPLVLVNRKSLSFYSGACLCLFLGSSVAAAGASRGVMLPFLGVTLALFLRGRILLAGVMSYMALVSLMAAFISRSEPGFSNFWLTFSDVVRQMSPLEIAVNTFEPSFPGLSTLAVAMDAGSGSGRGFLEYGLYLLPLPSQFYPEGFFDGLSLSPALGIEPSVLGINYDFYSEGFYWFGGSYYWMHAIFLACFLGMPWVLSAKFSGRLLVMYQSAIILCSMYMFLGGMVFSLRAGTRPILAVVILFLGIHFIRRLNFSSLGSNRKKNLRTSASCT